MRSRANPYAFHGAGELDMAIAERLFGFTRRAWTFRNAAPTEVRRWAMIPPGKRMFTEEAKVAMGWGPPGPEVPPFADALREVPFFASSWEHVGLVVDMIRRAGIDLSVRSEGERWIASGTRAGQSAITVGASPETVLPSFHEAVCTLALRLCDAGILPSVSPDIPGWVFKAARCYDMGLTGDLEETARTLLERVTAYESEADQDSGYASDGGYAQRAREAVRWIREHLQPAASETR